ncbi:hypothetical protein ACFOET_11055 [Parapedobacter deserti]|uniref:Uncharacterized protein n=1 Tax=Parapedobacter deserti TaxID=1912957 RepID=A0ABV7JMU2_9SPHI
MGAVIAIDFDELFGVLDDNGSVIVSDYSTDKWTFSTIFDPKYGNHPVSGNRDFGYEQNDDGSYTFYTRGVDRLTTFVVALLQSVSGVPFNRADELWASFQNKINDYVNQHGGASNLAPKQVHRPDWGLVEDVINGDAPLSSLSKDCPD